MVEEARKEHQHQLCTLRFLEDIQECATQFHEQDTS